MNYTVQFFVHVLAGVTQLSESVITNGINTLQTEISNYRLGVSTTCQHNFRNNRPMMLYFRIIGTILE